MNKPIDLDELQKKHNLRMKKRKLKNHISPTMAIKQGASYDCVTNHYGIARKRKKVGFMQGEV